MYIATLIQLKTYANVFGGHIEWFEGLQQVLFRFPEGSTTTKVPVADKGVGPVTQPVIQQFG
jgi:hypothetical protein